MIIPKNSWTIPLARYAVYECHVRKLKAPEDQPQIFTKTYKKFIKRLTEKYSAPFYIFQNNIRIAIIAFKFEKYWDEQNTHENFWHTIFFWRWKINLKCKQNKMKNYYVIKIEYKSQVHHKISKDPVIKFGCWKKNIAPEKCVENILRM